MKYFMLFIAFAAVVFVKGDDEDEKFMKAGEQCGKDIGIDKEVWMKILDGDLKDPKLPEFLFCVYKQMELMSDNGEFEMDKIISGLTKKFDEKIAKEVADCAKEAHGSAAENALHLTKCYDEYAPEE